MASPAPPVPPFKGGTINPALLLLGTQVEAFWADAWHQAIVYTEPTAETVSKSRKICERQHILLVYDTFIIWITIIAFQVGVLFPSLQTRAVIPLAHVRTKPAG